MIRPVVLVAVAVLWTTAAGAQSWLEGEFATSAGLCSGAASTIEDGATFSLAEGFRADESDCEILSVTPSARRDAVVLEALCIFAGMNRAESFAVVPADEGGLRISGAGSNEGYGIPGEETEFVSCG